MVISRFCNDDNNIVTKQGGWHTVVQDSLASEALLISRLVGERANPQADLRGGGGN